MLSSARVRDDQFIANAGISNFKPIENDDATLSYPFRLVPDPSSVTQIADWPSANCIFKERFVLIGRRSRDACRLVIFEIMIFARGQAADAFQIGRGVNL